MDLKDKALTSVPPSLRTSPVVHGPETGCWLRALLQRGARPEKRVDAHRLGPDAVWAGSAVLPDPVASLRQSSPDGPLLPAGNCCCRWWLGMAAVGRPAAAVLDCPAFWEKGAARRRECC